MACRVLQQMGLPLQSMIQKYQPPKFRRTWALPMRQSQSSKTPTRLAREPTHCASSQSGMSLQPMTLRSYTAAWWSLPSASMGKAQIRSKNLWPLSYCLSISKCARKVNFWWSQTSLDTRDQHPWECNEEIQTHADAWPQKYISLSRNRTMWPETRS